MWIYFVEFLGLALRTEEGAPSRLYQTPDRGCAGRAWLAFSPVDSKAFFNAFTAFFAPKIEQLVPPVLASPVQRKRAP